MGGGGGLSIYEQAAMQASPDAVPNGVAPEQLRDDGERIPCSSCGRKFNSTAISKHEKICYKVFQQKRKAFNVAD